MPLYRSERSGWIQLISATFAFKKYNNILIILFFKEFKLAYKHLDFRKRCQIYGLLRAGFKQNQIAKEIGVHKSTISRELKRNITFLNPRFTVLTYGLII
ncbi:MAG: helix-turn-helix domain-containing protein [Proteobacteria bacterium]|nr:helix-turn-helix domain-containing protein [Pseudomonadota bacterium]